MTLRSPVGITRTFRYAPVATAFVAFLGVSAVHADDDSNAHRTTTPIKHVIVLIGENRSFDNVFGTYVPKQGQSVSNLLSRGIVDPNGQPGSRSDLARQFQVNTIPGAYFINTSASNKVEITSAARIVGDIKAPRVVIAEGAKLRGSVQMDVPLPRGI